MRSWLKKIRIQKKLTQEDVANMSEISRSFYTHVENGTKTPSVDVAMKIAKSLGFEWALFFTAQCSLEEQNEKETVKPTA